MRGAGIRGIGAFVAAVVAASCGWPEYAFEPPPGDDGQTGGAAGTSEPSGGTAGASGGSEAGGTSGAGAEGGSGGSGHTDPCENGRRDGAETGIDCGGGTCPACAPGSSCDEERDCDGTICTTRGVCELLSCSDRTTNGEETDTDCGGTDCELRCGVGDECVLGTDCSSGLCTLEGRCTPPECDPSNPCSATCPCENGLECTLNEDCASGNCEAAVCAEGPRVLSRNDDPSAGATPTAAILQTFVVQNDGASALPLGDLTLRYYFTSDGLGAPDSLCDASRAVPFDACDNVETPVFGLSPATPFADAFVEVRFPDGPELGVGERTGETPIRVEPPNAALYDQSDDYSFDERSSLGVNAKVTLYRKGVLVFGREP